MKKRENFTIDEDVMKDFETYVASENMSKSATVEGLIKDFLNNKKKKSELIEKEQVDKLNELVDELNNYKDKIQDLSSALYEVTEDEICCELLKESDLYTELYDLSMNLPLDYDYLAYELEGVYDKAVDILKKKNNSKFLLKDYLSDELSPVDKDYIINSGVDYDKWIAENEKLGLDISRYKYLTNPNIIDVGNIYYMGDKVASKVILNPNVIFDESFGLKIVAERERLYAKTNDNIRFHPDFNQFALYYFLKDYQEIDTDEVFEVFEGLCFSITENGIDKIPTEVIDYVIQYCPYTPKEILEKLSVCLNKDLSQEDIVEIYKYVCNDSFNLKANLLWSLNKEDLINKINDNDGFIIKGEVKVKDIIAVYDYSNILVNYKFIENINIIRSSDKKITVDDIDVAIVRYIYGLNENHFELNDLSKHLEKLCIDLSQKDLEEKVLNLPRINFEKIQDDRKILRCLISSVSKRGNTIFVTKS